VSGLRTIIKEQSIRQPNEKNRNMAILCSDYFNINGYKKCSIIVKYGGWSFMIAAAQAEVNNPRKK